MMRGMWRSLATAAVQGKSESEMRASGRRSWRRVVIGSRKWKRAVVKVVKPEVGTVERFSWPTARPVMDGSGKGMVMTLTAEMVMGLAGVVMKEQWTLGKEEKRRAMSTMGMKWPGLIRGKKRR